MSEDTGQPPRFARMLLRALSSAPEHDALDGDLLEEYRRRLGAGGSAPPLRWWYRLEIARSLWSLATFGVSGRTVPTLLAATLLGATVVWLPQLATNALNSAGRLSAPYGVVLTINLIVATILAPFGGLLSARISRPYALAGSLGVATLLFVPAVISIWLLPQAQPLWARCAWIALVPTASLFGGSAFSRRREAT